MDRFTHTDSGAHTDTNAEADADSDAHAERTLCNYVRQRVSQQVRQERQRE